MKVIEDQDLFVNIPEADLSSNLQETLKTNIPLALAINTEKARSELIIINILLEIKKLAMNQARGDEWKFIKLKEDEVYIDIEKYYTSNIKKIIGILLEMINLSA